MKNTKSYLGNQITNLISQSGLGLQKRLLTIKEAAEYLGRSVSALRELQWAGRLPYVQEGRRVLFDILDLNAWIEKHKRQETSRMD